MSLKFIFFKLARYKFFLVTSLFILLITSCSSKKQILLLQDADNYNNVAFNNSLYTIQPNDILRIKVEVPDYETATGTIPSDQLEGLFNIQASRLEGYMVSPDLTINHQTFGTLNVKDKTEKDLEKEIELFLLKQGQLKNPLVKVKILNKKYTIQGEVNSPGTIDISDDPRMNILQAIGRAGGLTINGKRKNIQIIRQNNGVQEVGYIDLTSASVTQSPYFYIKQNDWIYVQPNGPKIKQAGYIGNLGTTISVLSVALSTYLIIRANF